MERIHTLAASLGAYETRVETFEGKPHIVAPVTLMVEGVHAGSAGPLFYPASELAKFAAAWNGIPLPVGHPEQDGQFVIANHPQTLADWSVGRLFNVVWNAEKAALQGEIWVDTAKAQGTARGQQVLEALNSKAALEVSTGLFFDIDQVSGEWNGEKYAALTKNYRPDHLALLPHTVGACSVADGCGVRVNEGYMKTKMQKFKEMVENMKKKIDEMMGDEDEEMAGNAAPVDSPVSKPCGCPAALTADNAITIEPETDTKGKTMTLNEFIESAPAEFKGTLLSALNHRTKARDTLIANIMAHPANAFSKETLEGKACNELEAIAAITGYKAPEAPKDAPAGNVDYSLNAPPAAPAPKTYEPLAANNIAAMLKKEG